VFVLQLIAISLSTLMSYSKTSDSNTFSFSFNAVSLGYGTLMHENAIAGSSSG